VITIAAPPIKPEEADEVASVVLPEHGFEGELEPLGPPEIVKGHVEALTAVLLVARAEAPLADVDGVEPGLPPLPAPVNGGSVASHAPAPELPA
jgi:hypothetical protein